MSKSLQESTRQEIDRCAVLSQRVYDNKYFGKYFGEEINSTITIPGSDSTYTVFATSESYGHDMEKLIAFAVKDSVGNIYIVYRGTGDGKWLDNGEGMFEESTPIQQEALKFYNKVITNTVVDNPNFKGRVLVTGHSKGGNLAQYVTMTSEHGNLIDSCYSIDGQGFSADAMEKLFPQTVDYSDRIEKLYSINGQNDYVDPLGIMLIPESRTFFVKNTGYGDSICERFTYLHKIEGMMCEGGLNWDYTEVNGEKVYNYNLEPGPLNKLIREVSEKMMELDEEELEDCAITSMYLFEIGIGDVNQIADGYRNTATLEEITGFLNIGIPMILNILRESENTDAVFELFGANFSKDDWWIDPLCDTIIHLTEDMTMEELEGYITLINGFSDGVDFGELIKNIKDNPSYLLEIYASRNLGTKSIHKLISKVFSPYVLGTWVGAAIKEYGPKVVEAIVDFVAAGGVIGIIADCVVKNWDKICEKAELIADYVQDEIAKFYNEAKQAVQTGINHWLGSVCTIAEKCITMGDRVVNKFIDGAADFWDSFKEKAIDSVKTLLFVSNPLIYIIASKVYKANKEPVRINIPRIRDCVDRMNNLARRVANIDARLDNLYWRLAQNNIEKEEGIFTSLANMYNLFRADLNVDEGAAIKRKARALSDLYDGYESTEKWVMDNVPQKI